MFTTVFLSRYLPFQVASILPRRLRPSGPSQFVVPISIVSVLAVFAVVQGIEGYVLQPKIIGDRVGLHPMVIIVAIMTGTTLLGGVLGGLLAIPLAAVLRVLMARYVWKRKDREVGAPKIKLK